jgi:hypothetical protein
MAFALMEAMQSSPVMPAACILHRLLSLASRQRVDGDAWLAALALDDRLLAAWALEVAAPLPALAAATRVLPAAVARSWLLRGPWFDAGGHDVDAATVRRAAFVHAFAECLADALAMTDPATVRLRLAVARSGLPSDDPLVADLRRFAGVADTELEDAHPILRVAAWVAAIGAGVPGPTPSGIDPERFDLIVRRAEERAAGLLGRAGIGDDSCADATAANVDATVGKLRRALAAAPVAIDERGGGEIEAMLRACARGPVAWLPADADGSVAHWAAHGLAVSAGNARSGIAEAMRSGEVVAVAASRSVVDAQVLARLGAAAAWAVRVPGRRPDDAGCATLGVLLAAPSDVRGIETALAWLAVMLGERIDAARRRAAAAGRLHAVAVERMHAQVLDVATQANNALAIAQNYLHVLRMAEAMPLQAPAQLAVIVREVARASELLDPLMRAAPPPAAAGTTGQAAGLDDAWGGLAAMACESDVGLAMDEIPAAGAALPAGIRDVVADVVRHVLLETAAGGSVRVSWSGAAWRDGVRHALVTVTGMGAGTSPADAFGCSQLVAAAAAAGVHVDLESATEQRVMRVWAPLAEPEPDTGAHAAGGAAASDPGARVA